MTYKINAIFIYSYSHIALTALYLTSIQSNLGLSDLEFFSCLGIYNFEQLMLIISQIKIEIEKLDEINEIEVKEALKTVKKFKKYNPDYYKELEKQKKYELVKIVNILEKLMILEKFLKKNQILLIKTKIKIIQKF